MRNMVLRLVGGLALLLGIIGATSYARAATAVKEPAMLDADALLPLLKKGGYFLVMRHERTEVPAPFDDYSKPATDCNAQRNLSAAGYAGSQETGKILSVLEIPISRVLASPMCRTMATARLAFSKAEPEMRLIHHDNVPGRTPEVSGAEMRALIAELDPGDSNIVLVSHIGNINRAIDTTPSEGEFSIVKKLPDGTIKVIGMAMGSDFSPYARQALMKK